MDGKIPAGSEEQASVSKLRARNIMDRIKSDRQATDEDTPRIVAYSSPYKPLMQNVTTAVLV